MSLPVVEIRYCPRCRWLTRAAWMAQELLETFSEELGGVRLSPAGSGEFQILCDGELVWCRRRDGGFPDITHLKQRVRDRVAPGRGLGHADRGKKPG